MLALKCVSQLKPSRNELQREGSLNNPLDVLHLIEHHSGFAQWRFVLPDQLFLSAEAAEIHGFGRAARSEHIRDVLMSYVPGDREKVVEAFTSALETRAGFRIVGRIVRGDGSVRAVECLGNVKSPGEHAAEAFGVIRDITDTACKDALAQSRAKLIRHFINDVPAPMVVLDRKMSVISCTQEWAQACGLTDRSEATGRTLLSLVPAVPDEALRAVAQGLLGNLVHTEMPLLDPETGDVQRLGCTVLPWQGSDDQPSGVLLVFGAWGQPEKQVIAPTRVRPMLRAAEAR